MTEPILCNATMPGGGSCSMEEGHKGYHAHCAYSCDGCGKIRRGQPHKTYQQMVWGELEDALQFCFLCSDERVIGPQY